MIIGLLVCEGTVPDSQSLKAKRMVIKSILDRAKNKFNVSASETDYQDLWQRTELAFACVSSEKSAAEKVLSQVLNMIDQEPGFAVTQVNYEWL